MHTFDNLTTICGPIIQKMLERRRLNNSGPPPPVTGIYLPPFYVYVLYCSLFYTLCKNRYFKQFLNKIQILYMTFWTLPIYLFLFKTQDFSETGDRDYPYRMKPTKYIASEDEDRIQCSKHCFK
jgi:hypothetical protein